MSELDEMEYARLAAQVEEIEIVMSSGQPRDVGDLLKQFLHNAKSRMDEIRHDEISSGEKRDQKAKEIATSIAHLVEMEQRLSSVEKQQYAGFLNFDYFTKANFDELENFYASSWDKLSEGGKDQMSARVWEGIKRKEFTFDELPHIVKEKESERMYLQLTGKIQPSSGLQNIPPLDRADFVREYESGNEKAATQVLNRESFAMKVSTTSSAEGTLREFSVSSKKEAGDQKLQKSESRESNDASEDISLAGVVLAEASDVSSPAVRNHGSSAPIERG